MSAFSRVSNIVIAAVLAAGGMSILYMPEEGPYFIALLMGISLLLGSLRQLIYYFTTAKDMVGGRRVFYNGLIFLDFSLFTFCLSETPGKVIMFYMVVCLLITGVLKILKAYETHVINRGAWVFGALSGIFTVFIAFLGLWNLNSETLLRLLFAAGLFHEAVVRIFVAFSRSEVVYFQ